MDTFIHTPNSDHKNACIDAHNSDYKNAVRDAAQSKGMSL